MAIGNKLNRSFRAFIEKQPVFFVATAGPEGRVNLSPKGMGTLEILCDTHVRWLNLTGSGNETAANLRLSDRMTLMFCAFEGDALILRVYGTANATHPQDADWAEKAAAFPNLAGSRQVIDMKVDMVQTSYGYGVPFMEFKAQRGPNELVPYFEKMARRASPPTGRKGMHTASMATKRVFSMTIEVHPADSNSFPSRLA